MVGTRPMRVAAIDCGTNSIRLLVADVVDNQLVDVRRRMEIVRLGQGVDRTGRIDREALNRTLTALRDFAAEIKQLQVDRVRMVATSATRDASNRKDFVAGVQEILHVEPEIVSGEAEAQLSFVGATHDLTGTAPFLVLDIGGGSTEFVLGVDSVTASVSVDIGCVRLTERHLHHDPPTPAERDDA